MSARSDGKGLAGQLIPAPRGRDARSRNAPSSLAFGTGLISFSQSVPPVAQAILEPIRRWSQVGHGCGRIAPWQSFQSM